MKLLSLTLLFLLFTSCGDSPFSGGLKELVSGVDNISNEIRFDTEALTILRQWDKGPIVYDSSTLTITFKDSANNLKDPAGEFSAYIWMPDMGHGSYPITVTRIATGVYQLTDIYFTMGGLWDFHLQLKDNGNLYDSISWPLTL
ncbi:FixH family protein [Halobacteriovorax sp. RT-2-6]|uniref:FixH family protein n=1 Tax=unclassified Halobacteriovorax TaxID=2639665 RepID=UPI00399B3C46